LDSRQPLAQVSFEEHILRDRDLQQLEHFHNQDRNIDLFERGAFVATLNHELPNDLVAPDRGRPNHLKLLWNGVTFGMLTERKFRGREDASQQVIEVVSDPARQQTDRFQFLTGECCLMISSCVGKIMSTTDQAEDVTPQIPDWDQIRAEVAWPDYGI